MASQQLNLTLEGAPAVTQALQQLASEAEPAMQAALFAEGTLLMADSQPLVPRDTGNLAASGTVQQEAGAAQPTVLVGYGGAAAPYALSVHENPRSGKTGGVSPSGQQYKHWATVGQWKYLEQPFKTRTAGFSDRIAKTLRLRLLREK